MKIRKAGTQSLVLGGITYPADDSGSIDVPDNLLSPTVWSMGFVAVKAVDAVEAPAPAVAAADPSAAPADTPALDIVQSVAVEKPAVAVLDNSADGSTDKPKTNRK
ncbi:MAG: hypothetical protein PHU14_00060 [Methylovulum sp.]|nr:hypothetical protein [Methylovulum sp.]